MAPILNKRKANGLNQSSFDINRVADDLGLYAEGSIVYMYMEDFITYDRCECYPGPYMNMIMGPNGTGKSTVVAAMVLGLGWQPAVLGRSKDVTEFIKYGRDHAIVEVGLKINEQHANAVKSELKLSLGEERVLLLRRELTRTRGKQHSGWFINGHPVGARAFSIPMRLLNVQIDNLCQFLPQDKVSEFAKLTPVELLIETEKAAAPGDVYEQHQQLIELRAKEREITGKLEEQNRKLTTLSKLNETMEALVQKIQQREEHLKKIKLLERKRPWVEYSEAREACERLRGTKNTRKKELEQAEAKFAPLKNALKEKQEELKSAEKKRGKLNEKVDKMRDGLNKLVGNDLDRVVSEVERIKSEIFGQRQQRKIRETQITDLKRVVRQLEQELAATETTTNAIEEDKIKTELKRVNEALKEIDAEVGEVEAQQARISKEGDRLNQGINKLSLELRQLDDVKSIKLEHVRRMAPDVMTAYEWIQANRSAFKEPVYGPLCLEINLTDPSLARQFESVISRSNLLNFVVTHADDLTLLQRELVDRKNLVFNVTLVESLDTSARNEMNRNDLKQLGFVGVALDFVESPAPVQVVLVDILKLHLIPLAKGVIDHGRVEDSAIRQLQKYASSEGSFEIIRSRYSNEVALKSMPLRDSLFFGASASEERKTSLRDRITEIRCELKKNSERMKRILQEKDTQIKKQAALRSEKEKISDQRRLVLEKFAEVRAKKNLLDLKKGNLEKLIGANDAGDDIRQEDRLKRELKNLFLKHSTVAEKAAEQLMEYKNLLVSIGSEFASLALLEGEIARLEEQVQACKLLNEDLRNSLAQAEREFLKLKEQATSLYAIANRDSAIDKDTQDAFSSLPDTLEELDRMLHVERTRAEISNDPSISASALREYEQRKVAAGELQREIETARAVLSDLSVQMDKVHGQWLPAVESMTLAISGRFTAFFAAMKCAGEVRLASSGKEYEKWSLEILVRFRDTEPLHVLSAHRQSGGEKSVSTILFLLSLQELAKSPFRVVDEINQGMDARNERLVHSLIVDTATQSCQSQYQYVPEYSFTIVGIS